MSNSDHDNISSSPDDSTRKAQKITRFMGVASITLSMITVVLVLYVFLTQ